MTEIPVERIILLFCVLKSVVCYPPLSGHHDDPRYLQGPTHHWSPPHGRHTHHPEMCRDTYHNRNPSIIQQSNIENESQVQVPTFTPKRTASPQPSIVIGQQIPGGLMIFQEENIKKGMCTPEQKRAYRYDKESGTCKRLGSWPGICPNNLMSFYPDEDNEVTGYCDCKDFVGTTFRPLVYWPQTDQCYQLYSQGPCSAGKWLIQMGVKPPVCTKRYCPDNPEEESQYWFTHLGMCFQADTCNEETTEFCKTDKLKLYHVGNYTEENNLGYLRCLDKAPIVPLKRTLVGSAKDLPCKPGHKKSLNGECSRITKFV